LSVVYLFEAHSITTEYNRTTTLQVASNINEVGKVAEIRTIKIRKEHNSDTMNLLKFL